MNEIYDTCLQETIKRFKLSRSTADDRTIRNYFNTCYLEQMEGWIDPSKMGLYKIKYPNLLNQPRKSVIKTIREKLPPPLAFKKYSKYNSRTSKKSKRSAKRSKRSPKRSLKRSKRSPKRSSSKLKLKSAKCVYSGEIVPCPKEKLIQWAKRREAYRKKNAKSR
jgi:hypothetical protein